MDCNRMPNQYDSYIVPKNFSRKQEYSFLDNAMMKYLQEKGCLCPCCGGYRPHPSGDPCKPYPSCPHNPLYPEQCCCPGTAGPAEDVGPTGPAGDMGPAGPVVTDNSMFAANATGATIAVILAGTLIPLPSVQSLDAFAVNGANTVFTVPTTGRYYLSYNINLTAGAVLQSQILLNGAAIPASVVNPIVSVSGYSAQVIVNLTAGDTISLQLSGLLGAVVLQNGAGASLAAIRLQ
ncbi:hypothetical protein RBU61_12960 [Tissierella sp. MB52-C2]|uniref:BclA C-terminal domain-containing protein n=1 Tax=Tissierella sp. MB52-C2 TaxID=3070999 RepID=UPI00280B1EA9|nr:hypothetical protein [Tissierella sp. MB52-C2]WMM23831.1 hypothetical protein RBU61_12960 [Tissierella sp. MB52-C2]